MSAETPSRPRPDLVTLDAHEDSWALDELMTAQPEATQAYFRERLRQAAPKPAPAPDDGEV